MSKTEPSAIDDFGEAELREERDFLFTSLADLDAEFAAGDIDDHDYLTLKEGYTSRAAAVLRALDLVGGHGQAPSLAPPRTQAPEQRRSAPATQPPGTQPSSGRTASPSPGTPSPSAGASSPAPKTSSPVKTGSTSPGPAMPKRKPWKRLAVATGVAAFAVAAGVAVAQGSGERLPGSPTSGTVASSGPQADLQAARAALSKGDYLGAVKLYAGVLATDPHNPEALAYQGWILRLTGVDGKDAALIDRGLASVRAAETADPQYPDAHFFAGEILLKDHQDAQGAASEFCQFLTNNPPAPFVPEVNGELQAAIALARSAPAGAQKVPSCPAAVPAPTTTGPSPTIG